MQTAVKLKDVTWTYSGSSKPAIERINLEAKKGEAILITGPTGAGKTTLCCCLNGLIPDFFPGTLDGEVIINEKYIPALEGIPSLSRIVGLVFQDPSNQLLQPTVVDDVAFTLENYGLPMSEIEEKVRRALEVTYLKGFENRNPHTLSGGEQQLCAIASILALDPDIYVLDEPTANLDPIGGAMVASFLEKLLKRREKTFLIVSHRLEDFLYWVDRMVVMNEGEIILNGAPRTLLGDENKTELMRKVGVNLPQMSLLTHELKQMGIIKKVDPLLTIEGYAKVLAEDLKEGGREKVLGKTEARKGEKVLGKETTREPIVKVEGLTHIYPGGVVALIGVNLEIYAGELVAFIGQNGSGKTTLVKHFNGLLKPSEGKVIVDGIDTREVDIADLSKIVGLTFQNPDRQIFNLSVRKEVELGLKKLRLEEDEKKKRVLEALEAVGLKHAIDIPTFSLSLGERQRLTLASVLVMNPKVIVVDEPTTGQDLRMRLEIMDLLKEINNKGRTVIIVTHDMDLVAKYAERCVVMHAGRIIADGPTHVVLSKMEILESTRLRPPEIARFSLEMGSYGIPMNFLTVEEAISFIKEAHRFG